MPAARPRGRRGRRHGPVRAERRERGGGARLPRPATSPSRAFRASSSRRCPSSRRSRCGTSRTCTRPTRRRARSRGEWPRDLPQLPAGVHRLRDARDPPRARPLHGREGGRYARGEVLALLPAQALQQEDRGDRVRDRRHPRGRLREDQRDEPGRGPPPGGPRPGIPRAAGLEADRGDRRRSGGEPGAGVHPAVHLLRGDRTGNRHQQGRLDREELSGGGRPSPRRSRGVRWTAIGAARPGSGSWSTSTAALGLRASGRRDAGHRRRRR